MFFAMNSRCGFLYSIVLIFACLQSNSSNKNVQDEDHNLVSKRSVGMMYSDDTCKCNASKVEIYFE